MVEGDEGSASMTSMKRTPRGTARPRCGNCKGTLAYEQLAGMAVYRESEGKRFYRVRCTSCGQTSELVRDKPLPASWSALPWEAP